MTRPATTCTPFRGERWGQAWPPGRYNAMVDYHAGAGRQLGSVRDDPLVPQHRPVRQILCRFRLGPAFHQRNET